MARQFGVISISGTTAITGIVANSVEFSDNVEKAMARNEAGKVTDTQAYSKGTTISVRGKLDTPRASLAVSAGQTIVISGGTYMIDSVTVSETNTEFADVALTASKNDNTTFTVYS